MPIESKLGNTDHAAPSTPVPVQFTRFLKRAVAEVAQDDRIIGMLRHGSTTTGEADAYSDLDLCMVVRPDRIEECGQFERDLIPRLGPLLVARPVSLPFGGQVVFCLFEPDLLRVEIAFKPLGNLGGYPEPPLIEWDGSNGAIGRELEQLDYLWSELGPDELEARFWLCVEYGVRRLARGELFQTIDTLAVLRRVFLGPMLFRRAGLPQRGLHRIETVLPDAVPMLAGTIGSLDAANCRRALLRSIELYVELRNDAPPDRLLDRVEKPLLARLRALR